MKNKMVTLGNMQALLRRDLLSYCYNCKYYTPSEGMKTHKNESGLDRNTCPKCEHDMIPYNICPEWLGTQNKIYNYTEAWTDKHL